MRNIRLTEYSTLQTLSNWTNIPTGQNALVQYTSQGLLNIISKSIEFDQILDLIITLAKLQRKDFLFDLTYETLATPHVTQIMKHLLVQLPYLQIPMGLEISQNTNESKILIRSVLKCINEGNVQVFQQIWQQYQKEGKLDIDMSVEDGKKFNIGQVAKFVFDRDVLDFFQKVTIRGYAKLFGNQRFVFDELLIIALTIKQIKHVIMNQSSMSKVIQFVQLNQDSFKERVSAIDNLKHLLVPRICALLAIKTPTDEINNICKNILQWVLNNKIIDWYDIEGILVTGYQYIKELMNLLSEDQKKQVFTYCRMNKKDDILWHLTEYGIVYDDKDFENFYRIFNIHKGIQQPSQDENITIYQAKLSCDLFCKIKDGKELKGQDLQNILQQCLLCANYDLFDLIARQTKEDIIKNTEIRIMYDLGVGGVIKSNKEDMYDFAKLKYNNQEKIPYCFYIDIKSLLELMFKYPFKYTYLTYKLQPHNLMNCAIKKGFWGLAQTMARKYCEEGDIMCIDTLLYHYRKFPQFVFGFITAKCVDPKILVNIVRICSITNNQECLKYVFKVSSNYKSFQDSREAIATHILKLQVIDDFELQQHIYNMLIVPGYIKITQLDPQSALALYVLENMREDERQGVVSEWEQFEKVVTHKHLKLITIVRE